MDNTCVDTADHISVYEEETNAGSNPSAIQLHSVTTPTTAVCRSCIIKCFGLFIIFQHFQPEKGVKDYVRALSKTLLTTACVPLDSEEVDILQ